MCGMDRGAGGAFRCCILPLLWFTIYLFSARVRRQTTTLQQEESDVLARASEGLTSIRIVHAFGQEEYEVREFVREARESYAANLKLTITNAVSSLAVSAVMALGLSVVLYVATLHILDGRLSVGATLRSFISLRRDALPAAGAAQLHGVGAGGRGGGHAARVRDPRRRGLGAGDAGREADAARAGRDRVRECRASPTRRTIRSCAASRST